MDIIALLTTMREAGFETGTIVTIVVIALFMRKDMLKIVDKRLGDVATTLSTLSTTLQEHIVQTDLRLQDGVENFAELKADIKQLNQRVDALEKENT